MYKLQKGMARASGQRERETKKYERTTTAEQRKPANIPFYFIYSGFHRELERAWPTSEKMKLELFYNTDSDVSFYRKKPFTIFLTVPIPYVPMESFQRKRLEKRKRSVRSSWEHRWINIKFVEQHIDGCAVEWRTFIHRTVLNVYDWRCHVRKINK